MSQNDTRDDSCFLDSGLESVQEKEASRERKKSEDSIKQGPRPPQDAIGVVRTLPTPEDSEWSGGYTDEDGGRPRSCLTVSRPSLCV